MLKLLQLSPQMGHDFVSGFSQISRLCFQHSRSPMDMSPQFLHPIQSSEVVSFTIHAYSYSIPTPTRSFLKSIQVSLLCSLFPVSSSSNLLNKIFTSKCASGSSQCRSKSLSCVEYFVWCWLVPGQAASLKTQQSMMSYITSLCAHKKKKTNNSWRY